jgi:hypothetical protein
MMIIGPSLPDTEPIEDNEFRNLMRMNLRFRFAMIRLRAIELGEDPPEMLYDTSILDPEENQRAYEQKHIVSHHDSMRHLAMCRDLGYDPSETSPELLASLIDLVAVDHKICVDTNDFRNRLLHPADTKRLVREQERIDEANEFDRED